MLVSVIIPTYNCAEFLPSTIESVVDQSYTSVEIIVVDDGSTDDTKNILEPYLDKITYIYQNNQGVSAARNRGIQEIKGELVAFIDADDCWYKDKLKLQLEILNTHDDIIGVFSDFGIANEAGEVYSKTHVKHNYRVFATFNLDWQDIFSNKIILPNSSADKESHGDVEVYFGSMFRALFLGNFINTSSLILRKNAIEHYGVFNHERKTQEDYEFWLKIAKQENFAYINCPLLYSRRRANQLTSLSNQIDISKNSLEVIENIVNSGIDNFIDKKTIEGRLSDKYRMYGINLLKIGDKNNARKQFYKSITIKHFDFMSMLFLISSYVPSQLNNFIRSTFKAIR